MPTDPPSRSPATRPVVVLFLVVAASVDRLLELRARRRIFDHVKTFPGLHLRELARQVDLDPNHVRYHVRYLEQHGLVSGIREGGYVRYFPRVVGPVGYQDVLSPREKAALAVLRRPAPLRIVLVLLDRETASVGALAAEINLAHSTVNYHLRRMAAAGVVELRRNAGGRKYALTDPEAVLAQLVRHRPPDALVQGFLEAFEALDLP